jgi:hypothetical protein
MYYQGDRNKEDEMCGACSMHERDEKFTQNYSRKPEGKRALGRPRYTWNFYEEG